MIWWGLKSRTNPYALMVKLALRMFEDSVCGGCGHSTYLAHGLEGFGEYVAETITCHACKALEKAVGERKPGERRYARDLHEDPRDDDQDDDEEEGDDDGGL